MSFKLTLPRWCWVWPWLPLLGLYTHWGWLNPDHWSLDAALDPKASSAAPAVPGAQALTAPRQAGPVAPGTGNTTGNNIGNSNAKRTAPRPEAPWPDEPAIRQQLGWHSLRALAFKTGPQRAGTTEVRLDLQWQGRLAECLDMLQLLALWWPQMRLDALILQAQTAGEWKVEWRGWWRLMVVPTPLPMASALPTDIKRWATHPVFNARMFQSHQAALWRPTQGGRHLLPWLRPDQLQWVALVHGHPNQAWVTWQQHTVAIAVGDRVGPHGGLVRSIGAQEITITEGDVVHRLRPQVANLSPATGQAGTPPTHPQALAAQAKP
jgi:hypothetical protein